MTPHDPIMPAIHPDAGFTLVELLVGIVLLSLLSLAIFGSVRFGIKAWDRGSMHAEEAENTLFAQNFLRQTIGSAYPFYLTIDPTRSGVDFEGTSRSLSFLAPVPIALGSGGRVRFRLAAEPHGDRADLVVTSQAELADLTNSSTMTRKALMNNVHGFELAYFGAGRSDRAGRWRDSWSGETALPQIVRVRLRFAGDDARIWPDLLIAPHISVDVGCVYDPLTKQCQGR